MFVLQYIISGKELGVFIYLITSSDRSDFAWYYYRHLADEKIGSKRVSYSNTVSDRKR